MLRDFAQKSGTLVKKPPRLPRGKMTWGVVKWVRMVKTKEGLVKTKLEVVFWNATMTNLH